MLGPDLDQTPPDLSGFTLILALAGIVVMLMTCGTFLFAAGFGIYMILSGLLGAL